jgi:hypothetical protein
MDIEIIAVISGAVIAGVIGICTVVFSQFLEARRTKKYIYPTLLEEVLINQARLQNLTKQFRDALSRGTIPLSMETVFGKTIYSALADKIGLLDQKSIEKSVFYYTSLTIMEEKWNFNIVRGQLHSNIDGENFLNDCEVTVKNGKSLLETLNSHIKKPKHDENEENK